MKKGNAFRLLILIIGLAVAVASISVSIAYMLRSSDEITNTFIPAKVACQINETVVDKTVEGKSVPYKTSVAAQNTGKIRATYRRIFAYALSLIGKTVRAIPLRVTAPKLNLAELGSTIKPIGFTIPQTKPFITKPPLMQANPPMIC